MSTPGWRQSYPRKEIRGINRRAVILTEVSNAAERRDPPPGAPALLRDKPRHYLIALAALCVQEVELMDLEANTVSNVRNDVRDEDV